MHVLIINHEFPPIGGGAATASAHLAREMTALGARVTVLTSAFGDLPRHERRDGADIVRVPALRRRADKSGVPEFASFVLSSLIWALGSRGRGQARSDESGMSDAMAAPENSSFPGGERGCAGKARMPESGAALESAQARGDFPEKTEETSDAGDTGEADRFDACIAFFGLPGGPAAWLLRLCHGVPYIVSLRGGDVPGFLPRQMALWHRCTGWLIRALWRGAASVVGNSAGLTALAHRAAPDLEILTIPNGVDAARFAPTPENGDPAEAGQASGQIADAVYGTTPPGACRLLFTGRLNGQKNLPCLLQALVPLRERAWTLTLVGDGPDRAMLERTALSLGLADRVRFAGWADRDALPEVLRRADVYVFPSIQEGMPNTVLEAMACGLPVVACRIEGCEELVRPGETGLLTPPDDAPALTEAVERLLDDAALRRRMGREGRRVVEREYTWRATAEQYLALCGGAR